MTKQRGATNDAVLDALTKDSNLTTVQLAKLVGVSRQRVQQILKRAGLRTNGSWPGPRKHVGSVIGDFKITNHVDTDSGVRYDAVCTTCGTARRGVSPSKLAKPCLHPKPRGVEFGQQFGRWLVLKTVTGVRNQVPVLCLCGRYKTVEVKNLIYENTHSCLGCPLGQWGTRPGEVTGRES